MSALLPQTIAFCRRSSDRPIPVSSQRAAKGVAVFQNTRKGGEIHLRLGDRGGRGKPGTDVQFQRQERGAGSGVARLTSACTQRAKAGARLMRRLLGEIGADALVDMAGKMRSR